MFGIDDYPAFLGVCFALHAVPGQDVLFVLAQGLRGGSHPAAIGALGIGAGSVLFAIATALGQRRPDNRVLNSSPELSAR